MRHLPNLKGLGAEEISDILARAHQIKSNPRDYHNLLEKQDIKQMRQTYLVGPNLAFNRS